MKKKLALVLSIVMTFSLLAACGPKEEAKNSQPPDNQNQETNNPPSTEITHVSLELISLSVIPSLEATKKVENDINDYIQNTLGENIALDLSVVNVSDFFTTVPMELAGGTGPDLVMMLGNLSNFQSQGYLLPLDDYLDNELKPTVELLGNIMGSGKIAGHTYMVPRYFGTVLDWKFIYDTAYTDGVYDMTKVHDMASLEECLEALKAKWPNERFLVYNDQFDDILNYTYDVSIIGTYAATVGESTTLVNYYETDAFKEAIEMAYRFRQKGYSDPEGSANTLSHDAVIMAGTSKGVIMGHSADCAGTADMFTKRNTYGATFGAVTLEIGDLYTDNTGIGISYTCKNPSAAAKFINMLYCDEFVWTALIYGAEGQDYVWLDDAHTQADYPEGLDANTIPYNCLYSCGIIGNGFRTGSIPMVSATSSGSDPEYGMKLMNQAWCPPLYGFTPDPSKVSNEIAAVSNVVDQYLKPLTYGDVNPDELYPQFIDALKAAGIDNIIADYQAQVDEWVKENK
ncbi:MAG: extracellular solute-binding protein [Oscillospiraceae bacterium]|nr:extracellular solute-binding protein [Oscillospiraceae bacterium]